MKLRIAKKVLKAEMQGRTVRRKTLDEAKRRVKDKPRWDPRIQ